MKIIKTTTSTFNNIIFKTLSMIITFASTLLITKVVVLKSGSDMYGFYSLSNDFVNYAMVLSTALNSMSGRYITLSYYQNDTKNVRRYFTSVFVANIFISIIMAVIGTVVICNLDSLIKIPAKNILDVKILFALIFVNFFVSIISSVFFVATFLKNRVDLDSLRQIESNCIKILLVLILFYSLKPNIAWLGVAVLASTMYIFYANIKYTKYFMPEVLPIEKKYISFTHVKEIFSSGIWNSITRIGAILLNGVDLLIANLIVGSQAMGMLSISKTLPKYFLSAVESFSTVFNPSITIAYAKGNIDEVVKKVNFSVKICAIISNLIEVVIIVLGVRIYTLWVPNQDANMLHILSVVAMLGYILVLPFESLWTVFTVTNKVKISSIYLITESVVSIGMVFLLLNGVSADFWQLVIIAGVSSIAEIIRGLIFLPIYSAFCLKISKLTFYKPIVRVLIALVISISISFVIENIVPGSGLVELIILIFVLSCVSVSISLIVILQKQERSIILNKIIKLIKRR